MRRDVLLVLCLALVGRLVLLPLLPVQDPDEGRYGQIAKRMVESGDWVTPRFWHEGEEVPFLGKPPLQFWMAAVCMRVFGVNKVAGRLPGLAAAAGLVLLLFRVLRRYAGRDIAETAAVMAASAGLFFALAGTIIVDMVLAFFVAGALLAYYAFLAEPESRIKKRWSLLVFALLAGGFMTKGPVAIVLFGLPTFAWTAWHREWKGLKHHAWTLGIPLFLLLTVPWFVICEQHNPGFLKYFFLNENLLRYVKHEYGDLYGSGRDLPRGTAVGMMLLVGLPWTVWALLLLWKHRREGVRSLLFSPGSGFFLLCFVSGTLFWCLARQLLLTYLLPLVPPFCAWLACLVHRRGVSRQAVVRVAAGLVVFYTVGAALVGPWFFKAKGKATEGVLEQAAAVAGKEGIGGPFLFVRKTPYSAHFHAHERLLVHPSETVEASVCRGLAHPEPCLMLFTSGYLRRVPGDLRARIRVVGEYGDWYLCIPERTAGDSSAPGNDAPSGVAPAAAE
jgi:4-amino-4-deoxy-L-arabinose transferase-like glycosyltransferase